ncbi:MAG TPA: hypothetical protein VK582_08955 [Pyrinomonadaceae bacterium]|nr:hypothetical protein [Pyrinomonadaceae bacterium]
MKSLKRLGVTVALTFVLTVAAFAGETPTPPCAPPVPGETPTPPCAAAQMTPADSVAPGETPTPPASSVRTDFSVADVTIDILQSVLLLF